MSSDVRWLTAEEERVWRRWLTLNARLSATLYRELQDDAGLSMPDFEVLVHLTDSPQGRIRVTDLARLLQWERSRASHHVTRMEGRRLVFDALSPEEVDAFARIIDKALAHLDNQVEGLPLVGESKLA